MMFKRSRLKRKTTLSNRVANAGRIKIVTRARETFSSCREIREKFSVAKKKCKIHLDYQTSPVRMYPRTRIDIALFRSLSLFNERCSFLDFRRLFFYLGWPSSLKTLKSDQCQRAKIEESRKRKRRPTMDIWHAIKYESQYGYSAY